jgi:hypothetical protein
MLKFAAVIPKHALKSDPRVKQLLVGIGAIFLVCAIIGLIWYGGTLPGFVGEWFAMILGIITTPFLMEGSFIVLGLLIVMLINHWRLRREVDELVYLERAEGPGSEAIPESARWAIYKEHPLDPVSPGFIDQAEGALEIGDHDGVVEALTAMTEAERESPLVLGLRIRLADATGKDDLAARLRAQLDASNNGG